MRKILCDLFRGYITIFDTPRAYAIYLDTTILKESPRLAHRRNTFQSLKVEYRAKFEEWHARAKFEASVQISFLAFSPIFDCLKSYWRRRSFLV